MNNIARIYRAEMIRAVLGPGAGNLKVADLARLNRLAEHMAECEDAQAALRAKGYGRSGMTFLEVVREVPVNALGRIKTWFAPKAAARADLPAEQLFDIWSSR